MKKIVLLLAGMMLCLNMQAQVTDNCSDAVPISLSAGVPQIISGTTVGATDDGTEGVPLVWVSFTTPGGTCNYNIIVDYCNSPTPIIYFGNLGDICGPLGNFISPIEMVSCGISDNQTLTFADIPPNTTYVMAVVGYFIDEEGNTNEEGPFQFSIIANEACGLPNDACDIISPSILNNGGTVVFSGTTVGATINDNEDAPTVWEAITLPPMVPGCTYDIDISYCGSPTIPALYYTFILDDCMEGTGYGGEFSSETFCNDGNFVVSFFGVAPGTYYIPILGAYNDGLGNVNPAGPYSLTVSATSSCGPSNDLCSNVTPLNLSSGFTQTVTGTTVGANVDIGEDYPFVWEAFTTPTGSGCTYSLNVSYCNSPTPLVLFGNLTTTCGPGAEYMAPGPFQTCISNPNNYSMVFSGLTPGTTYYLPILGYYNDGTLINPEGNYMVDLSLTETCAPPNDLCSNVSAVLLQSNVPQTFTGTTVGAQWNGNENGAEVWEAFTLPGNTSGCTYTVELSLCGTNPIPLYYENLYTSCDMNTSFEGILSSCSDGNYILTFENMPPGTYYYPVVGAYEGNPEGPYTMTVTASAAVPPTPTISVSGNTEFCEGGSVTLTSSASSGNLWSNGATTNSIVVSQNGSYSVSITGAGCPSASSESITVVVNPPATVDGIDVTLGSEGYVNATAMNPQNVISYIWNFGDGTGNNPGSNAQDHTYTSNGNFIVTLTVMNNCGTNSSTLSILIDNVPSTDIADQNRESQQLLLFPNPTSGVLHVELNNQLTIHSLTVYDLSGRMLIQRNIQDKDYNNVNIDLSNFSSGTYLLKITTNQGSLHRKFEIIR